MVRIRVLDVDGDAGDVQAVLDRLAGVVTDRGGGGDAHAGVLELAAGEPPPADDASAAAASANDAPTAAPPPPTEVAEAAQRPPGADAPDIEDVSLEEDVGVRFEAGPPPQIHIHRRGRGRHMHEFVLPDGAPARKPHAATCSREIGGRPCDERRTFRLL